MHNDECTRALKSIAPQLNHLKVDDRATIGYDLFADALVWSDEYPEAMDEDVQSYQCLRIVLRYRTAGLLGEHEDALEVYWNAAKELFPDWPGFRRERCTRSAELQQEYIRLKGNQGKVLGGDCEGRNGDTAF